MKEEIKESDVCYYRQNWVYKKWDGWNNFLHNFVRKVLSQF